MREITKYLYSFIKKEWIHKNDFWKIIDRSLVFSTHSTHFISSQFQQIEKYDAIWKARYRSIIQIKEIDFQSTEMTTLFNTNPCEYVSTHINESVKKAVKKGYQYSFSIGTKKIKIYLIYPFSSRDPISNINSNKMEKYFNDCVRKMFIWLNIAYMQSNSHCGNELNIYVYLSEFFKLLPETQSGVLDRENANTAYTTSCSEKVDIHICRQEEWFKVFIHETFHCLGLDFSHRNDLSVYAKTKILNLFQIESEVNLYEAYCETFANIMNILFFIHEEPTASVNVNQKMDKIQRFRDCMLYEILFSLFQTAKILHFYGIHYRTLIDNTGECDLEKYLFKESNTNILSYYIIKMIFLFNLDEYLSLCRQMNGENTIFDFKESEKNIDLYVDFIERKHDNSDLLECIDWMYHWYIHRKKNNCLLEYQIMRLSLHE